MSAELAQRSIEILEVIPQKPVEDVRMLPGVMDEIKERLGGVGLGHVAPGLNGYQEVSKEVLVAINDKLFKYPEKMEETMPVFADLFFQALRSQLTGDTKNLSAWSPLLNISDTENALPSTGMYDFMQIHIRCDLYKALLETKTQPKHREDYEEKINDVLTAVAHRILYDYVELHPMMKRVKIPEVALKFILREIFKARDEAWAAFELVRDKEATIEVMDVILQDRAHNRMISTRKLAGHTLRQTTRVPEGWRKRSGSGLLIPKTAAVNENSLLPSPALIPTQFNLPLRHDENTL